MSKYADLPDIDTAPDIYETDDVFPSSQTNKGESSDEEAYQSRVRGRNGDVPPTKEELDSSSLIGTDDASKKFRKAEKRRASDRARPYYAYPPSPDSPSQPSRPIPLSQRLRALKTELASLEGELEDPSNPLLHSREKDDEETDAGALIRGLVDVRGRLEKIEQVREGRAKLVRVVTGEEHSSGEDEDEEGKKGKNSQKPKDEKLDVRGVVEIDKRVGELERLVGSASAALDETSPLPPPLLPLLTRLSTQLTLLTQPRHIDSISRRLKLLLSDLDRVSAAQHAHGRDRRATSPPGGPTQSGTSATVEQLLPLLSRLGPLLPQIPHILTRLRTLATLHTTAGEAASTLAALEAAQAKSRSALEEMSSAVEAVEKSVEANKGVIKGNVEGLEERVQEVLRRVDEVQRQS